MCVLALAWDAHPRWRLVLIGNRDEYHDRPAAPLARWDDAPHLIAGRDLRSGGTWLGISEQARCVVVTNLRGFGAPDPARPSRGALVTALLDGADPRTVPVAACNPVNLIALDGRANAAHFLTNHPALPACTALTAGLYGLSNGRLDEPWPKTMQLKSLLLDWLTGDATDPAPLIAGLREEKLPDAGFDPPTPSDVPQEPVHSPVFIRNPVYGTRCSSVVMIDRDGQGLFVERRYSATADPGGDTRLSFVWRARD